MYEINTVNDVFSGFSGEFVNQDRLSGQVNPNTSNKDPQSISKPIVF